MARDFRRVQGARRIVRIVAVAGNQRRLAAAADACQTGIRQCQTSAARGIEHAFIRSDIEAFAAGLQGDGMGHSENDCRRFACAAIVPQGLLVIPAQAGFLTAELVIQFFSRSGEELDPSLRWDDG